MIESPYEDTVFAHLSSLSDSDDQFYRKGGPEVVETFIKDLIVSAGTSEHFGACLLHRHSSLEPGYAMVEFNGTSTAWKLDSFSKHGGNIVPIAWLKVDEAIYPYEFCFVPCGAGKPAMLKDYSSFVEQYFSIVQERGLTASVGLRRAPIGGKEFLEVTEGSTNIMIPADEVPRELFERNTTETMWFFDPNNGYKKYRCSCRNTGSATNPNHNHIDS